MATSSSIQIASNKAQFITMPCKRTHARKHTYTWLINDLKLKRTSKIKRKLQ